MSSVAQPGTVAIASCSPRLPMRAGARLTASPASVTRVVDSGCEASAWTTICSAATADSRSWIFTGSALVTVTCCSVACSGGASARIAYVPGATFGTVNAPSVAVTVVRGAPRGSSRTTVAEAAGCPSGVSTIPVIEPCCSCPAVTEAARYEETDQQTHQDRSATHWMSLPDGDSVPIPDPRSPITSRSIRDYCSCWYSSACSSLSKNSDHSSSAANSSSGGSSACEAETRTRTCSSVSARPFMVPMVGGTSA